MFQTDFADKIVHGLKRNGKIYVVLQWKPRKNGFKPKNTVYIASEVRKWDTDILINFQESNLVYLNSF